MTNFFFLRLVGGQKISNVKSISNDQIRYLKIDLRLLKTNDLVDIINNYYVNPDKKRLVIKINDKTYAEVIKSEEIVNCPHCGRILYKEPETEEIKEA